jgi:hypothetical protein
MTRIGCTKSLNKISDMDYLEGTGHQTAGAVGAPDVMQRSSVTRVGETRPVAAGVGGDMPSSGQSRGRRRANGDRSQGVAKPVAAGVGGDAKPAVWASVGRWHGRPVAAESLRVAGGAGGGDAWVVGHAAVGGRWQW